MKNLVIKLQDSNGNNALAERSNIFSGSITLQTPNPGVRDHGVIFTFFDKFDEGRLDPSATHVLDIANLDPAVLLNTVIENTHEGTLHRFHVIGGYFIEFTGTGASRQVITHNVFGAALAPEFGIAEGAKRILVDNWKLRDPERGLDDMDERKKGPDNEVGWTLIVEEAVEPRRAYPFSGDPIKLIQECADIVSIAHKKMGETETSITYQFTARTDRPVRAFDDFRPAPEFSWNLDNDPTHLTPGNPVEKTFTKTSTGSTHPITVSSKEIGACGATATIQVPVSPLIVVPCPEIGEISQIATKSIGTDKTQFDLKVAYTGATPTRFTWKWKHLGKDYLEETTGPSTSIVLDRDSHDDKPVNIYLYTYGPGVERCYGESHICVNVPQADTPEVCPWYMRAVPYFLALIMTMVISAVIVCYVAENIEGIENVELIEEEVESGGDWLYVWTTIVAFLFIGGIFVWMAFGKKAVCVPRICSALMILATSLIGSAIFTVLIGDCFEDYTLLAAVLLILGIIAIAYYHRTCTNKFSIAQLLIFIAMGVFGVILAIGAHAEPCLYCV